jgi:hypothetical protein
MRWFFAAGFALGFACGFALLTIFSHCMVLGIQGKDDPICHWPF